MSTIEILSQIEVLLVFIFIIIFSFMSTKMVPQQDAWIVQRFGKYHKTLNAGLNFIMPFMDQIAYKHTLKERAVNVVEQTAITKDNVTLLLDGILYVKVTNPVDASYGVENPYFAVTQLAQTSMRSAIGKLDLDKTFEERDVLNTQIVMAINEAAVHWGIQCMRYEIRDIKPPATVLKAMETQVAAERQKRANILESEGKMQSIINLAEAQKKEVILNSEAEMQNKINTAKGESEAIIAIAAANASAIKQVGIAINENGGTSAVNFKIAEQYINAFQELAKTNNTMIIPANNNEPAAMIAQALGIYKNINMNDVNKANNNTDDYEDNKNVSKKKT